MRCEACDAQLKNTEGRWDPIKKQHETLCRKCLIASGIISTPIETKSDDELPLVRPTRLRE